MTSPAGVAEHCDAVRDRLVGALTLATGDRSVAEELAQEALVRTWQHWDSVAAMDSPEGWTFRVGFNLAGSWRRRRAAELRANRRGRPVLESSDPPSAEAVALRQAVAELPARQRSTVIARYYLGLDVAGTAELLGCAAGTVKSATAQAIANLRAAGLGDLPEEDGSELEEVTP